MIAETSTEEALRLAGVFRREVLDDVRSCLIGKDEVIDLLGVSLIAGENLYLYGPPGTAKSATVRQLAGRLKGRVFDYLLTRFSEPSELFGPFDIRRLREGELITNTEGMLPEADFVFLDELLNANSAVLNSLLMALNERIFRRGRETRTLETLMVVGAGNHLPEEQALGALFDRFLLRVDCRNVPDELLSDVLQSGRRLQEPAASGQAAASVDDIRRIRTLVPRVDLAPVQDLYVDLIHRLRHAGIDVSDRRAVKLQNVIAAGAVLCGRCTAIPSDLWVLRYIWDSEEQQEPLAAIVQDVVDVRKTEQETNADVVVHPRARGSESPDPERIAADLERIRQQMNEVRDEAGRAALRDRLALLSSRIQWVAGEEPRQFLADQVGSLWPLFDHPAAD